MRTGLPSSVRTSRPAKVGPGGEKPAPASGIPPSDSSPRTSRASGYLSSSNGPCSRPTASIVLISQGFSRASRLPLTRRADTMTGISISARGNSIYSARKLSITVQLSDPADYEGGDLEFFPQPRQPAVRDRGAMIIFPSFIAHRVTPISHGTRRSLVAWVSGTTFR